MSITRTILCLADPTTDGECFLGDDWRQRWSEVHHGPAAPLLERLGAHLRLPADAPLPEIQGLALGLHLTEIEQLQNATAVGAPWTWVVFEPSATARLDCLRLARQTLVAARRMPAGHRLRAEDVESVRGRGGVGSDQIASVIGRALCYPLERGDDITFGFID